MIIWFALVVPLVAAITLASVPSLRRKTAWFEYFILFAPSFVLIPLFKWGSAATQTHDTEWWTNYAVQAQYYEPWVEEWEEYVAETGYTDSDGNYHMTTPAHWEHRIRHHPKRWEAVDNADGSHRISEGLYRQLVNRWKNEKEKNLVRNNQTSHGDGDMWYSNWTRKRTHMECFTTKHTYENRIQCSKSIFNFPPVSEEDAKTLFTYPKVEGERAPSILGGEKMPKWAEANGILTRANAELGYGKNNKDGTPPTGRQIRMWLLLFGDQPQDQAILQESLWKGGNKNEMVVCIGTSKTHEVKWCYVFSWTEKERLKIDIRQFVHDQDKIDLPAIVTQMRELCSKQWVRKEFADFSYLTVEPGFWCLFWTYFVQILVVGGIVTWVLMNDLDHDLGVRKFRGFHRRRRYY